MRAEVKNACANNVAAAYDLQNQEVNALLDEDATYIFPIDKRVCISCIQSFPLITSL